MICEKGHRTIRMKDEPCPHPGCWRGGTMLVKAQLAPLRLEHMLDGDLLVQGGEYSEQRLYLNRTIGGTWAWTVDRNPKSATSLASPPVVG